MEDVAAEDLGFVNEEVDKIIVESLEAVLGGQQYDQAKTQIWINDILERIMKQLNDLGRPFKYMTTCMIQQRNGAGFYTTNAFYWDSINDGFVTKTWPDSRNKDQQNKTMQAVVTVFGIVF